MAFSGGADSAFLARVAHDALGPARARAVTAVSPSLARRRARRLPAPGDRVGPRVVDGLDRRDGASRLPRERRRAVLPLQVGADGRPGATGGADRGRSSRSASTWTTWAIIGPGSGRRVSGPPCSRWWRPASPRPTCGHGPAGSACSTWDKPAAACLASRVPYGTEVVGRRPVDGGAGRVSAAAPGVRRRPGPPLRPHRRGSRSRSRICPAVLRVREAVVDAVRAAGYDYVTLDLEGLRSGNLNRRCAEPAHPGHARSGRQRRRWPPRWRGPAGAVRSSAGPCTPSTEVDSVMARARRPVRKGRVGRARPAPAPGRC